MKKIAIVGKPNVGKSSLFNALSKTNEAITSEIAGTTRDIKKRVILLNNLEYELIDTGGIEDRDELFSKVKQKAIKTAKECDIVLYLVDGRSLAENDDKKLFYELQQNCPNIALILNKIDNRALKEKLWDFQEFGAKNLFMISVAHRDGLDRMINWITSFDKQDIIVSDEDDSFEDLLEEYEEDENGNIQIDISHEQNSIEDDIIKVAIIGRTNVGKSSLLNALLNEERSIVSEVAGTTIDPVDEETIFNDKVVRFVDTAGIRRKGKIIGIEKYALMRTEKMLENADIAILVLDSSEEFKELDEKIAGLIDKHKLGCIIVMNKWDNNMEDFKEMRLKIKHRFKFLAHAPILAVSAKTKRNIDKLKSMILEVFEHYSFRISTSKLNEIIQQAIIKHPIPSIHTKTVKIYYATQFATKPPSFVMITNKQNALHFSYKRYLINTLREHFNFEGVNIVLIDRKKGEKIYLDEKDMHENS
ncbi:MAG: ribosome biogenesis GTPase Der [Campylobacterales bacterium]|nr:ribosome biogenesis GTPase Der [Campylobacterales bacterium]